MSKFAPHRKSGHFIYECKGTRPYLSRPSRTQQLENPKVLAKLKAEGKPSVEVPEEFKTKSGTANRILEAKEKERAKAQDKGEGSSKRKRCLIRFYQFGFCFGLGLVQRLGSDSDSSGSSSSSGSDSDSDALDRGGATAEARLANVATAVKVGAGAGVPGAGDEAWRTLFFIGLPCM
ncbi:uncharacterized protein BXZ73DRAFT_77285 [Epithele typhae]|uniref:uncharacterized protein n=1 Tax=Epithele typhae TaxID=378194 RepID=UPI002007F593|nr:uncharacterized protein BXZ73DRAFT_77285 [Epithele typhae]KAH9933109.1 hypothetical protein BXZ73DRAFT_77285 [Epithele typhae]